MPPHGDGREYGEENYVAGAHGTIAEQLDEAHYDDRSDASDDVEKGRIKFPSDELYGRDRELRLLREVYAGLLAKDGGGGDGGGDVSSEENGDSEGEARDQTAAEDESDEPSGGAPKKKSFDGSRVVFLSGYSGVGKSALVEEFAKRTRGGLCASGKYSERNSASAPFSAVTAVLERLVSRFAPAGEGGGSERARSSDSNLRRRVSSGIDRSPLIKSGADGNKILKGAFPVLVPLLDRATSAGGGEGSSSVHPSMNAIKESTCELLSIICDCQERPLILFLDDLQWADEASIDILSNLLSRDELRNVLWICAYRSNEVHEDHSFAKLMDSVAKARMGDCNDENCPIKTVEKLDLFSLSLDAVTRFIADCVKKDDYEDNNDIAELAEVVYQKTMGNIFFVKQALEELVRKNVLFYDVMCFEWRWVVSKVELANYMSDDVVETVKGKIKELSNDIQHLLIVMSHVPNALDVPLLAALAIMGDRAYEEDAIRMLLKEASDEGMVIFSVESGNYILAHDRIRQACREFSSERDDHDEILLHISHVLMARAGESEIEWYLFVAVDILDSLPPQKSNPFELARLNLRVSKIAKMKGASFKEHDLLLQGLKCLQSSGLLWKEYGLTLEFYDAVILSEYSFGSFDKALVAIEEVIQNGKSLYDKLHAYTHRVLCKCDKTRDYTQGVADGLEVLNLYGYDIPAKPSKARMAKEEMQLKVALKNCSFSCLANRPPARIPIVTLLRWISRYSLFSSQPNVLKIVAWKSIQCTLKQGIDRDLPMTMALLASSYAKEGRVKTANEIANCALALSRKIGGDVGSCAFAYSTTVCLLQSFHSSIDRLHQCYKALKLEGNVETALGSMLGFTQAYLAAGLELGPLFEAKLSIVEEYCRDHERTSFLSSFQISRQFALNLRKRLDRPTQLEGEAFNEKEVLDANGPGNKMILRDSSSHRIFLAVVFWDEALMADMLDILADYPLSDQLTARLHNRLCYTGLAAISLGKTNEEYRKLGQKCMAHFAHLSKRGSVNARAVYLLMCALTQPSGGAFKKAINSCAEAKFIHLEAIALERYAAYLNALNNTELANDCITTAYWLYKDWGAMCKALALYESHSFLKNCKRANAKSITSITSGSDTSKPGHLATYTFNSTFKSRGKVLVQA